VAETAKEIEMKSKSISSSPSKDKFLGETKGNRDLPTNRTVNGHEVALGHDHITRDKFLGATKGNTDLPPNRSHGQGGKGGKFKAGGAN